MNNKFNIEYPYKEANPVVLKNQKFKDKLKLFNKENIIIISDFDFTMTRRFYINPKNNKKEHLLSGFGFYDLCPDLPEKFRKETMDLKLKYLKYENDNTIEYKERDKYIHYLFTEDIKKIVELHLNRNFLEKSLESTFKFKPFYFRHGVKKFYELITKNNIPQIIISGGVKDSIQKTLNILDKNIDMRNIKIISNEFIYDKNDVVIDYKKPLIYTFNKSKIFKENVNNLDNKCILFLGDHINDVDAIENINCLEKLCIVFNNNKNEEEEINNNFLKKYDCVKCNDGDFLFINELVQKIINKNNLRNE